MSSAQKHKSSKAAIVQIGPYIQIDTASGIEAELLISPPTPGKLCEKAIQTKFLAWTKEILQNKKKERKKKNWHNLQLESGVG